ncbi:MAG: hypothetical protein AAGG51_01975 [Cyanobacteria bacterium P01_G01_bin.54]
MNIHDLDKLQVVVLEWDSLWDRGTPYEKILRCIEKYSFGNFNEFDPDYSNWQPYDFKAVLQKLKRRKKPCIGIRESPACKAEATLSSSEFRNIIQLIANRQHFESLGIPINGTIDFVKEISDILINFHVGYISGEYGSELTDFYHKENVGRVPSCFDDFLTWMHFLHPSCYTKYLTREDILGMPAQEVKEWENGIIQVQIFDHPFNYDTPENRQIIVEASEYLNERHRVFRAAQKE